jgi:hypothetical protein
MTIACPRIWDMQASGTVEALEIRVEVRTAGREVRTAGRRVCKPR